jgi:HAMP domain-containing protein
VFRLLMRARARSWEIEADAIAPGDRPIAGRFAFWSGAMGQQTLLERLVDFDGYGNTAIERFRMRMDAHDEIIRLQKEIGRLRDSAKQQRAIEHITGTAD